MTTQDLKRMQKEFGEAEGKQCRNCCNCRNGNGTTGRYCTAYGKEYNPDWPVDRGACGLYNRPFAAVRPKREPLGLTYEMRKRKAVKQTENNELQISLF